MSEKTMLTIRGEKMEDSKDFVRFFKALEGKTVLIYDVGFTQLSRTASKTVYLRIRDVQRSEESAEAEG